VTFAPDIMCSKSEAHGVISSLARLADVQFTHSLEIACGLGFTRVRVQPNRRQSRRCPIGLNSRPR